MTRSLGWIVGSVLIGILGGFITSVNFGLSLYESVGGRFFVPLLNLQLGNILNFLLGMMGLFYVAGAVGMYRLKRWSLYLILLATLFQIANLIYRIVAFTPPLPIVIGFWGIFTILGIVAAVFISVKRRVFRQL